MCRHLDFLHQERIELILIFGDDVLGVESLRDLLDLKKARNVSKIFLTRFHDFEGDWETDPLRQVFHRGNGQDSHSLHLSSHPVECNWVPLEEALENMQAGLANSHEAFDSTHRDLQRLDVVVDIR